MASDEPQPQMPGLGDQTAGRSAVVIDGAGVEEEEELMGAEGPLGDLVLIGMPCGALLLAPTPLSSMKQNEKVSAPPPPAAAPPSMKRCVQCGATETPQWRMQPKGLGALCNSCRIGHRPAEAVREPVHVHVHLPPPATATVMISESPAANGWMDFDAYLLKGTSPSPRRENPSPTTTEPAPAPEEKKEKRKRKPLHPRNRKSSKKQCQHCKSASTPQWRMVVMDPASTPALPPTQAHAGGDELPMGKMDQLLLDAIDGSPETHVVYGVGDNLLMGNPSSLDKFLFDGPAAPQLIDDDKDLVD